jgi:hypothetical protein
MPTFRCDFEVSGDLVLPLSLPVIELTQNNIAYTFKNGPPDSDGHPIHLVVSVIGPAESMDTAEKELGEALAERLHVLSFVTQSRFKISVPIRAIEWSPGPGSRQLRPYWSQDARYPPDQIFVRSFIDTVSAIEQSDPPAFVRTAMKFFRYGLLDEAPQDQFMRFLARYRNFGGKHRSQRPCSDHLSRMWSALDLQLRTASQAHANCTRRNRTAVWACSWFAGN